MTIIKLKTTASTNTYLRQFFEEKNPEELTAIVAEEQTAGRGQQGNHWESETGKNLLCSVLLFPGFLPLTENFLLSECIALSVKKTLNLYVNGISVKWPNDIYWNEKKIAGILIENEVTGNRYSQSIAGIGININQQQFRTYQPEAISLQQITGRKFDTSQILNELIDNIGSFYEKLKQGDYTSIEKSYHESLFRKSGFHFYSDKNGLFSAKIETVSRDGFLHLITDLEEKRSYMFKEVQFR